MLRKALLFIAFFALLDYLYNLLFAWRTSYDMEYAIYFIPEEGRIDTTIIIRDFRGTIFSLRSLSDMSDEEAPLLLTGWKYYLSGKGKVWQFPLFGSYNVLMNPGRDVKFTCSFRINDDYYDLDRIIKYQVFVFRAGDLFLLPPSGWRGSASLKVHLPPDWSFISPFEKRGKELFFTRSDFSQRPFGEKAFAFGLLNRIEVFDGTGKVNFFLSSLWSRDFDRHLIRRVISTSRELKRFLNLPRGEYPYTIIFYPEIRLEERGPSIDSSWMTISVPEGESLSPLRIGRLLSSSFFLSPGNILKMRIEQVPHPFDRFFEDSSWFIDGIKAYSGIAAGCSGVSEKIEAEIWALYLDYLRMRKEEGDPPLVHNHGGRGEELYLFKSLLAVHVLDQIIQEETAGKMGIQAFIQGVLKRYRGGRRDFSLREAFDLANLKGDTTRALLSWIAGGNAPLPPLFRSLMKEPEGMEDPEMNLRNSILNQSLAGLSEKSGDPFYRFYIKEYNHSSGEVSELIREVKEETVRKGIRFCPFEDDLPFFERYMEYRMGGGG